MVQIVAFSIVATALAIERIQATSLECNAFMPTGTQLPLTDDHPAVMKDYNGAVPVEMPDHCEPSATENDLLRTDSTGGPGRRLRRMEDATNSDVHDLEAYFGESLVLDFETLKEKYSSASAPTIPWPGSYWPTYQDSINVIWKTGDKSASEKYAEAYGLDPIEFQNKMSAINGVDAHADKTKCSTDTDCAGQNDGSLCAKRKGTSNGYCIPTWYGICHAWAPAAILENEPKCDVVKNGQTFHVMDIKALVTAVYDGSAIATVFTGARSNGPDTPVNTDAYGRYTNAARRDLGAGFFHLAITNIMGKHKQSFIIDITTGAQVWNQPVRSYRVQTMDLVDATQASQQYFGTNVYPFNDQMVHLAYVKTTVSWIVEAYADGPLVATQEVNTYTKSRDYEYLLELDANYAVIGGEWVGSSKTDHPDFLWFPTAKPDESTVTGAGLSYANVEELLELSVSCGASTPSVSTSGSASAVSTSASSSTSRSVGASMSASGSSSESTTNEGTSENDSSLILMGTETTEDLDISDETSNVPNGSNSNLDAPAIILDTTYSNNTTESTGNASPVTTINSVYYTPPLTSETDVPPHITFPEQTTVVTTNEESAQTSVHQSCH
ncbi:putative transglutaminase elicitor [Plasmopara halstedii]